MRTMLEAMNSRWFSFVHMNNLVYNTCWEDPRLDRQAMELGPDDSVVVITSAGCNALDYALQSPRNVYAVDMNPRQNALLELKMAGIRALDFDTFFQLFGKGRVRGVGRLYDQKLRNELSPWARKYWDRHLYFFDGTGLRKSFYFHGTSGYFAWMVNQYLKSRRALRENVQAVLNAETFEEQQTAYALAREVLWNRPVRWAVGHDATLAMVGVPKAQRVQLENTYQGGIAQFMEDCLDSVFAALPLGDNYFWRVYLTGEYTETCCPEYLKRENFEALKDGLVNRVHVETNTVENFLTGHRGEPITRFVLLDHMDWLCSHRHDALVTEWQSIVNAAAPNARILWRSGGTKVEFVDPIEVSLRNERIRVGDLLSYNTELAAELHQHDRVHTYGSFYIADLATA